jgi:DNA-binding NarL/FixJ family response regulator
MTRLVVHDGLAGQALTEREVQVLRLMAEGATDQAIGSRLGLSRWTIKTYVRRIVVKLNAGDRTSAVAQGYEHGWLIPGRPEASTAHGARERP